MRVLHHEQLATHTTLGIGGPARRLIEVDSEGELLQTIRGLEHAAEPFAIIGGGSNLVAADDDISLTIVRSAIPGLGWREEGDSAVLRVGAGEPWDAVVSAAVDRGLAGIECLAGIPGLAGAAPIQNIGAYGQELSQVLTRVRAFDRQRDCVIEMNASECQFGYRTSAFKRATNWRRFVVVGIELRLRRGRPAPIAYPELRRALELKRAEPSVSLIRDSVLDLRRAKGMVLDSTDPNSRSAGSFFVNPVVSQRRAEQIESRARADGLLAPSDSIPRFPSAEGQVKLPAAWLLERAGFARGDRRGGAAISSKHALALINRDGATARDLLALAQAIQSAVRQRFAIDLTPEPVFIGFAPTPTGIVGRLPALDAAPVGISSSD
jgi:UDP-N-acetylmuramate dehydrogenase